MQKGTAVTVAPLFEAEVATPGTSRGCGGSQVRNVLLPAQPVPALHPVDSSDLVHWTKSSACYRTLTAPHLVTALTAR